jgi:hypothetical protein
LPAFSRGSYHPSIDPSNSPEDWQGTVAELRATLKRVDGEAKALSANLDAAFKAAGQENAALHERLREAEEALRRAQRQSHSTFGPLPMATTDFDDLFEKLKLPLLLLGLSKIDC